MNILLVRPYWSYPYTWGEHTYNRIWLPLSLANCAAVLEREGHTVKILDAHALRLRPDKIRARVSGFDKVFITSSTLDRWQCPNIDITPFLETVSQIKKVSDDVYVIGYHGTVDPETILEKTGTKAVIRGAPEYIVLDICQNRDFSDIEGLSYIKDGVIVSNPDRDDLDLKTLPTPAYHLFDMKKYSYEILGDHFALFEISRGCKYKCKFCSKIMYGQKMSTKSKDQVIAEIRTAIEGHGVKTGYFIDLQFLANKKIVEDMCDFLITKKYGFRWCCQTRPDSLSAEVLNKMKEAGCALIHLGVESGLQEFLDYSGKNMALDKTTEAVRMCANAGIKTLAFYVFGFRGETIAHREEIFRFAKKLNTDFVSFKKMYPYEHSDIYSPDVQSNKEIDRFVRNAGVAYYLRCSCLRKLDMATVWRSLKLFCGRVIALP